MKPINTILEEINSLLARVPDEIRNPYAFPKTAPEKQQTFIVADSGSLPVAFALENVVEAGRLAATVAIADSCRWVQNMAALHSEALAVIDLQEFFAPHSVAAAPKQFFVCVEAGNSKALVVVKSLIGISRQNEKNLLPSSHNEKGGAADRILTHSFTEDSVRYSVIDVSALLGQIRRNTAAKTEQTSHL